MPLGAFRVIGREVGASTGQEIFPEVGKVGGRLIWANPLLTDSHVVPGLRDGDIRFLSPIHLDVDRVWQGGAPRR